MDVKETVKVHAKERVNLVVKIRQNVVHQMVVVEIIIEEAPITDIPEEELQDVRGVPHLVHLTVVVLVLAIALANAVLHVVAHVERDV